MKSARLDTVLVSIAVGLTILLLCTRLFNFLQLQADADQLHSNLQSIAIEVFEFKTETGSWFPEVGTEEPVYSYPDPFKYHDVSSQYQGLESRWFSPGNNHNMIVQLVRFDSQRKTRLTRHLFNRSFEDGEPFIRILLPYGSDTTTDTRILMMLQDKLPDESLAEIDDHYFVVDIRRFNDV